MVMPRRRTGLPFVGKTKTPEAVAAQIRAALTHITPERLMLAPDCGMKYLPRATAFAKLRALVEGTRIVRRELGIPD